MRVEDIQSVTELEISCFGESLGEEMFNRELTSNILAEYYCYLENDIIVAYISSWASGTNSEILNFCVSKDFQNKGIGSELLKYLLVKQKSDGIIYCSLEVRKSNEKAINLYKKFGFKESHVRKAYYKNGEDAILMLLNLKDVVSC